MKLHTVTRNEQTARQIHLHRGCYPFWYGEPRGIESHQWQTDVGFELLMLQTVTLLLKHRLTTAFDLVCVTLLLWGLSRLEAQSLLCKAGRAVLATPTRYAFFRCQLTQLTSLFNPLGQGERF